MNEIELLFIMLFGTVLGDHFSFASFTGVVRKTQNSKPSRLRIEEGVFSLQCTSSSGLKKSLQHLIFSTGVYSKLLFSFSPRKTLPNHNFLICFTRRLYVFTPLLWGWSCLTFFNSLLFQKRRDSFFSCWLFCLCTLWVKLNTLRIATKMPIWMAEVDTCLLFQQIWNSTYVPVSMKNETFFNSILNFYQYKRNAVYNIKCRSNKKMGNRRGCPTPKYIYWNLFIQV